MSEKKKPTDPDRDDVRCSRCGAGGDAFYIALCIIPGSGTGPLCEPCSIKYGFDAEPGEQPKPTPSPLIEDAEPTGDAPAGDDEPND